MKEAGERLGVSASSVRRLISSGELRVVDVGWGNERARIRVRLDDLQAFIDSRTYTAPAEGNPLDEPTRRRPRAADTTTT